MKLIIPEYKNIPINAVIFDLGAVIINIDYHLTKRAFEDLGIINFDDLFSKAKQTSLFDDFEKGMITPDKFRDTLRSSSGINLSDKNIDNAWNSMLLDIPENRFKLLQQIKSNYKTYLLSNTNAIHIAAFSIYIDTIYGINNFNNLFDAIYYSSKIHLRKPDAEIFSHVINQHHLDVATTLFIDDSIQHIIGANSIGMPTFHLKDGMDIIDLFA